MQLRVFWSFGILALIVLALEGTIATASSDWSVPFVSPNELEEAYSKKIEELTSIDANDRRRFFLQTYREITREMMEMLDAGEFRDPSWAIELTVSFANLYRHAFYQNEIGGSDLPEVWKLAFKENRSDRLPPKVQLLISVNAHVTRDLPIALLEVGTDFNRPELKADYLRIAQVFSRRIDQIWELLEKDEGCQWSDWQKRVALRTIPSSIKSMRKALWGDAKHIAALPDETQKRREFDRIESSSLKVSRWIIQSPLSGLDRRICRKR